MTAGSGARSRPANCALAMARAILPGSSSCFSRQRIPKGKGTPRSWRTLPAGRPPRCPRPLAEQRSGETGDRREAGYLLRVSTRHWAAFAMAALCAFSCIYFNAAQGQRHRARHECPMVESFMEPIVVASEAQLRWAMDTASDHLELAWFTCFRVGFR